MSYSRRGGGREKAKGGVRGQACLYWCATRRDIAGLGPRRGREVRTAGYEGDASADTVLVLEVVAAEELDELLLLVLLGRRRQREAGKRVKNSNAKVQAEICTLML